MNKFSYTRTKNIDEPQKVELELSKEIEDTIMDVLRKEWLIPILTGVRKESDRTTYYCFFLPLEDAELLKDIFMKAYTKATGYNTLN